MAPYKSTALAILIACLVIPTVFLSGKRTDGRAALDWLLSQPEASYITSELFEQATRSW